MLKIHHKGHYQAATIINQLPIYYVLCIFGKVRQITDQTFQKGNCTHRTRLYSRSFKIFRLCIATILGRIAFFRKQEGKFNAIIWMVE